MPLPLPIALARLIGCLALTAALAGCGGGGGGSAAEAPVPPSAPPPGDTATTTATAAYAVLGTDALRVALVLAPGGVTPILLESKGTGVVTWGGAAAVLGIPPTIPFLFAVSACAVDPVDFKAICIGYGSNRVGVVDLRRFATTLKISDIGVQEFDSGAGSVPNIYSGAGCVVCGVVADVGKHRVVIGGAGGFRVFDYGSTTASARFDIPVGENFAFLPQVGGTSYIIAPEYEPDGGQRKLRVVAVDSGRVYAWTRHTDALADLGAEGISFIDSDVDAASIDPVTRSIVLSNEHTADFMLVDFGVAVFDDATSTFSAPFAFARPNPATLVRRLTDLAISTTGSILLSHGESDTNVSVTQLPTTAGFAASAIGPLGVIDLNDPALDRSACGPGYRFVGKGDPHGLSLYVGLDDGQRGLVIDASNRCAALLDLAGLRDAPRSAGDPNAFDTALAAVRALVRFVVLK